MNKQKEEDAIRKLFNKPKVKDAIHEAYLDSLVHGVEINVDKIVEMAGDK